MNKNRTPLRHPEQIEGPPGYRTDLVRNSDKHSAKSGRSLTSFWMTSDLLIMDPDTELTDRLANYLGAEQFNVTCVHEGEAGVKKALNQHFDVIILELELPKRNGFEVIKLIREHLDTPILILTAREDEIDKILALEMGADDYLIKPCSVCELLARLHAILRRTHISPMHQSVMTYHDIHLDCAKRIAKLSGNELELTNTEFSILEILMKSPGQAFSKEELTEYALNRKYTAYDRSIDVHISNLRNKLGVNPTGETWITTVRGFGYLFSA